MAKQKTALTDEDNVLMVEVKPEPEKATGLSVEDAYRHLAGLPPEPVVEPEEG